MNANATDSKEGGESNDELRARWEGANYGMTVCANGVVNVQNDNYGDDARAHIYSVSVEGGHAVGCPCPNATYRNAHCKHQIAVEARPLVVSSGRASTSYTPTRQVATDGGHTETDGDAEDTRCEDCGHYFDGHDDPTCLECGGHGYPVRSEAPDMGGGESTGPELL